MVCYRNFSNQITGIQIRKNDSDLVRDEETGETENKYRWLSSNGMKDGCKVSPQLHYATDFEWSRDIKNFQPVIKKGIIILTEGAMKADLAHCITGFPFIAVPGVSSANEALKSNIPKLKEIGLKKIIIAYDMDRVMNIHVTEALIKMREIIRSFGIEVEDLYWSNEAVNTDGSHEMIDVSKTFIFTAATASGKIEDNKLDEMLDKLTGMKISNILFSMKNTKELTCETKAIYRKLYEKCQKKNLYCKPVFWSLKLKGIDDYYACNNRNVDYRFK
jgi:hypothetical protein